MDSVEGRRWFAHFFALYDVRPRRELQEQLQKIGCPTAVIWGNRDPYCPESIGRELAERIPNAEFKVLRGADHFVMEERPSEVSQCLASWLT
jgi:pimeloyl-ACP methyl ester carboxylesterase